jgi:multimeric flavodoxin WrbA
MKILAIIGSPRKAGNTYHTVAQIEENLKAKDESVSFEYLFLADYNLQMCRGCFSCIGKGAEYCPLKDGRADIEAKMLAADGIVFAAPCYAMGVPALMKNFIDRFAYTLHRPVFFGKAFLAVSTIGGSMGIRQALEQLALLSAGGRLAGKLGVICPPVPMVGVDKKTKRNIVKASAAFYKALQKKAKKLPGMGDFLYFHLFKSFTGFASYRKACPADYAYYRERADYFFPVEWRFFRKLAGRMVGGMVRTGMRLMIKERPVS